MAVARSPLRKRRDSIVAPQIPHPGDASSTLPDGMLVDEAGYTDLVLADMDLLNQSARDITVERASLQRVRLSGSSLLGAHFRDCLFDTCDLAQVRLDRGSGLRIALRQCRLLGLHAVDTSFTEAVFADCIAPLALFFGARFKSARFTQCSLSEASFQNCDLTGVVFRGCDLRQANFHGATLVGADLRGSQVEGLVAGARELQGVIVEPSQAALLAGLLGLDVRWDA